MLPRGSARARAQAGNMLPLRRIALLVLLLLDLPDCRVLSTSAEARAAAHFKRQSAASTTRGARILAGLRTARLRAAAQGVAARSAVALPPPSWLTITDYNVSTDGSADVSATIDAIGRAHTHGAVLLLPGGLGPGGAAAGAPSSRYLIKPSSGVWNSPPAVTLWIEPGAVLVAGPGVRSYLGGPLRVGAANDGCSF